MSKRRVEIDHYGERLVGCIECDRWSWPPQQLGASRTRDDLETLRAIKKETPDEQTETPKDLGRHRNFL